MKVHDEQFPPPVINMVEAYFQPEEARQRRALWPEVRSSGAEKGVSRQESLNPKSKGREKDKVHKLEPVICDRCKNQPVELKRTKEKNGRGYQLG
ncbi:hypothetical protein L3X38_015340 [Prunus dulcis]|uniref:Uncharacterized protein n=1 Tax=Prunus dulcis TaxID=3755 RepID=A0AAD4WSB6_PRUDU|nr:hypothetical protein L3X38_015340 [Prunus dulcis]